MGTYKNFDEQKQFACRVIADHARATAFAIADGILPGNEGRNYVLRKIMRRAIYHGRKRLGFQDLFFYKVTDFVADLMKEAFPELEIQREFIGKMVELEEKRFINTLSVGLKKLDELISKNQEEMHKGIFDFNELAKLNDTFGVPKDLIRVALEDEGFIFEEEEFIDHLDKAHKALQSGNKYDLKDGKGNYTLHAGGGNYKLTGSNVEFHVTKSIYNEIAEKVGANIFHGYDKTEVEGARVLALVKNDEKVDELSEGDEGLIVLSDTPFYAEAGGQVGDVGMIVRTAYGSGRFSAQNESTQNANVNPSATADGSDKTADKAANSLVKVFDTFAPIAGIVLHKSKIEKGSIKVGDVVTATVDVAKRNATRRNHTATHLVHAALKEVLGTHVKQAGSVVAPSYLRFDFTHYQAISETELQEIEDLVNRYILQNEKVNTDLMSIEEAMRSGAMALFGEKYGSTVRVLSVGGGEFSKELCGGTHVRATGDIGSFKITSDEAVASGVRRIRAITGFDAFARFREDEKLIDRSLNALKTQRDQLPAAIEKLQEELKKARRENDELKMKIATGAIGNASSKPSDEAKDVSGIKVIAKTVEGLDKGGMRHLSDTLMSKIKSGVVILARTEDDKVSFIVRVSDDLTDKVKAGKIVQEIAPIVSGRGGGKPDMAEGGGTDASKLPDALEASYGVVEEMLS